MSFKIYSKDNVNIINNSTTPSLAFTNPPPENLGQGTPAYPGVPISTETTVTYIQPNNPNGYYTIDDSNLPNGFYKIIVNIGSSTAEVTGIGGGTIVSFGGGTIRLLYNNNFWVLV